MKSRVFLYFSLVFQYFSKSIVFLYFSKSCDRYMDCTDFIQQMNHDVRTHPFGHVRPAKIQVNLHICSLIRIFTGTFWNAKDAKFLNMDNKDFDQTAWMRRLIRVFVGHRSEGMFLTLSICCFNLIS